MTGSESFARFTVEIFVKEKIVLPEGICLGKNASRQSRTRFLRLSGQKNLKEPPGDFQTRLFQIHLATGTGRALDLQTASEKFVVLLE